MAFQKARRSCGPSSRSRCPPGWSRGSKRCATNTGRAPALQRLPVEERPGPVAAAGPVQPGRHRRAGRSVLRVLQQGRVELRLLDGGPRRLRRPRGGRARHDQRGLLAGTLRRVPAAAHLPGRRAATRSIRPASRRRRKGRPRTGRRRSTCRRRGCGFMQAPGRHQRGRPPRPGEPGRAVQPARLPEAASRPHQPAEHSASS